MPHEAAQGSVAAGMYQSLLHHGPGAGKGRSGGSGAGGLDSLKMRFYRENRSRGVSFLKVDRALN